MLRLRHLQIIYFSIAVNLAYGRYLTNTNFPSTSGCENRNSEETQLYPGFYISLQLYLLTSSQESCSHKSYFPRLMWLRTVCFVTIRWPKRTVKGFHNINYRVVPESFLLLRNQHLLDSMQRKILYLKCIKSLLSPLRCWQDLLHPESKVMISKEKQHGSGSVI